MNNDEIVKMVYVIQDYLIKNNLVDAMAKDLMPFLIEKGCFKNDHRYGLHLCDVLRELNEKNLFYLLPQVSIERKDKNRFWFFNAVKI